MPSWKAVEAMEAEEFFCGEYLLLVCQYYSYTEFLLRETKRMSRKRKNTSAVAVDRQLETPGKRRKRLQEKRVAESTRRKGETQQKR